jgi:hypothetical protein
MRFKDKESNDLANAERLGDGIGMPGRLCASMNCKHEIPGVSNNHDTYPLVN